MYATIKDIMNIEKLKSFKLIAGAGGTGNRVDKVGILDFEFTRNGASQCVDSHWMPHDLIITTFLYARNNEALLGAAVKKLCTAGTSGIAIKNVFGLEIPREILKYADGHNFPIFVFTDNGLFFEDIVIGVNDLVTFMADANYTERKINLILHGDCGKDEAKRLAREINPAFRDALFSACFRYRDDAKADRLPFLVSGELRRAYEVSGSSIARYRNGFFYVVTAENVRKIDPGKSIDALCETLGLQPEDFHIGVGTPRSYLANFKRALLESLHALEFARMHDEPRRSFRDIGPYQFLLPHIEDEWIEGFYRSFILPLIEHDLDNRGGLLEFATVYECYYGNNKQIARHQNIHENTIRYRLGKIKNAVGFTGSNAAFEEQLLLAMKIHRVKTFRGSQAAPETA